MHIGFEVVAAVVVKGYIFWGKHHVVWWKSTDISEEHLQG
jgi:hypothetical protein